MELKGQPIIVTGGTRGLGAGVVEALVERGAEVTVVARQADDLQAIKERLGVKAIVADITDPHAAKQVLESVRPTVLVLNAGAAPQMGSIDELSWAAFTAPWEVDVKGGLFWIQAALRSPLAPGSRVLVSSSGAALNGSPLSGGYAGAKRMLWLMANYADRMSSERNLGIRFQTIAPLQMVGGTGVGDSGAQAYSSKMGISPEQFLERFGTALTPRQFGEQVVKVLEEDRYSQQQAFGMKGDTGIIILEEAAA